MTSSVTLGALAAVLAVALLLLIRRPAAAQRLARLAALAITVLVAAALTPWTVQDSGPAASFLLGVPVLAATVPVLAERSGRRAEIADLVAAVVIGSWGLLLALGIGVAFLPVVLLYLLSATWSTAPRKQA
ncbi:hypothetical protein D7147_08630 [Micromonospora musae]|uniref:Uncharacterized protein n=1 Tax=Micromonospora musae TaxID=1894970 RepID=A0A3A9Y4B8_9ACTN|nr:hypothetical protein [Micromonospora musae]RKN20876.1 hypothetical protein D7147_08630 [Micromonospora musae]RKN32311.1 hypothetical protein D7044_13730 [Micromonospora musae]